MTEANDATAQRPDAQGLPPAEGPSCWTGAALTASGEWCVRLNEQARDCLRAALAGVAGRDPLTLTARDFPLGAFQETFTGLRAEVIDGRGFVVLRTGFDDLSEDDARRLLWGLGQHLGIPQKQDGRGTLIHDVRDTGVKYDRDDDIRVYQTNQAQPFHNDGADMVALLCRRQAPNGGRSLAISAHQLFNEIRARRPDLARVLTEPFHFDARGQQLPGRPWFQALPIYQHHGGRWFVLHKRHYIDLAQRAPEIPRLTTAQTEALDLMDTLCDDPALHLSFEMQPGDLGLTNNFTVLHARTAFRDDGGAEGAERRHMLRLWLGVDGGVALPPSFRETREFGPLFKTTRRLA